MTDNQSTPVLPCEDNVSPVACTSAPAGEREITAESRIVTEPEATAAVGPVEDPTARRLANASFVFGIIGAAFLPLGLVPGFLGYTLSLDARRRGCNNGNMRAGRALSLVAMLLLPALYLMYSLLSCETMLLALM